MRAYEILGIGDASFTSKRTGEVVNGFNLHVAYEDKAVKQGRECDRIFISPAELRRSEVKFGDIVDIEFDRWGQIISITQIGEKAD